MFGGPVNGVPLAGMLNGIAGIGQATALFDATPLNRPGTDANSPVNTLGVIVPTVLQIAADVMNYWTGMTCLFDRYWQEDPKRVSLPVCMFYVKDIAPTYTVETSKKRVLVYEQKGDRQASSSDLADPMRNNAMRAIVDNAVKQPTSYNMEVILPFQPIGRYITDGVKLFSDVVNGMMSIFASDMAGLIDNPAEAKFLESIINFPGDALSSVFNIVKMASTAADALGRLPGMDGVSYINRNSLEAMAESCRTLCMKMWSGYEYKYVMITNMTYHKQPLEDGVFRATVALQEMPVLTVAPPKDPKAATINRNWVVKAVGAVQKALIEPVLKLTGVEEAAEPKKKALGNVIEEALHRLDSVNGGT
jgi:hypothetical protein